MTVAESVPSPVHPGIRTPRLAGAAATRPHLQLLPTLFDRLRDDHPAQKSELSSAYTFNTAQLRDIIQRDLAHLLNTGSAEDLIDRERHPEAASSCINFGVRPLAGSYLSERR